LLLGWVLLLPPITPATEGSYAGADSHPAQVGVADPLFRWTISGRYQTAGDCERERAQLRISGLRLDPASAAAVADSFARCVKDDDSRLRPDSGLADW
jgi:hypothetical protein